MKLLLLCILIFLGDWNKVSSNSDFYTDEGLTSEITFDLTQAINKVLDTGNETAVVAHGLELSRKVAYSPMGRNHFLMSDLPKISNVLTLLDKVDPVLLAEENEIISNQPNKSKLLLKFRYGLLQPDVLSDVLYDQEELENSTTHEPSSTTLEDLKPRLIGIIQEWYFIRNPICYTLSDCPTIDYYWNSDPSIQESFIESGKSILRTLFNASELHCFVGFSTDGLGPPMSKDVVPPFLQREVEVADAKMITITFLPEQQFPLSFEMFLAHKDIAELKDKIGVLVNLKIDALILERVVESRMDMYEYLIKRFMSQWFETRKMPAKDVVIMENSRDKFIKVKVPSNKTNIPYLFTHVRAVKPCALVEQLRTIATRFDSLVVNEHTWTAIVRYRKYFSDDYQNCQKRFSALNATSISPPTFPKNLILIIGNGTKGSWTLAGKYVTKQLSKYGQIGGMEINPFTANLTLIRSTVTAI